MSEQLNWLGFSRSGAAATIIGSVVVLPANARRKGATIVNDSVSIMYLAKGDVSVVNTGIPLNANGGSYEINATNLWLGTISVACAAAAANICWTEDI